MLTRLTLALAGLLAVNAGADPLTIAVSSMFRSTLEEMRPQLEQAAGVPLDIRAAPTGQLLAQWQQGAPFDLVFLADAGAMQRADRNGLIRPASRQDYALGELALWCPNAQVPLVGDLQQTLRHPALRRLAIANPATAAYGRAARQALEALEVSGFSGQRLIETDTIAQTFQIAEAGTVDCAFVAYSQVLDVPGVPGERYRRVPATLHAPLAQQVAVSRRSTQAEAALRVLAVLQSPVARQQILRHGYRLPGP